MIKVSMKTFLFVALGGALGSVARHGVNLVALQNFGPDFPYGTMFVNITGSLMIGLLAGLFAQYANWSQDMRSFAIIGILGGFTTFSSFSLDVVTLFERGNYAACAAYLTLSIFLSIAGLVAGLSFIRAVMA